MSKGFLPKRARGFKSDHALIELILVSKQIGINVGIRGALFGAKYTAQKFEWKSKESQRVLSKTKSAFGEILL